MVDKEGLRPLRATTVDDQPEDEISLLQVVSVVLKHRYAIVGLSLFAGLVVGVTGLLGPRTYTASGSFIPQTVERTGSGAAALAGQLGIVLPGGGNNPTESPEFYQSLIRSREILGRVLAESFTPSAVGQGQTANKPQTLLDLLEIEGSSEPLRREAGLQWLETRISPSVARGTGVVRVSVTTPWPEVSAQIGVRLLDLLNDFNRATRQTQAAAERSFIEERIVEAADSLRTSEDKLRRFLEGNRQYQNSPQLVFENERLQREVAMRQQLFTSLHQSYETARINEVRNTPLITVIEKPQPPVLPDPRGLVNKVFLALLLGGLVGIVLAFVREFMISRRETGDQDYRTFHQVWDETVSDVRRVLRRRAGSS
jgi:uncharacterized protein involved in exopolysaccharide biosynthesis